MILWMLCEDYLNLWIQPLISVGLFKWGFGYLIKNPSMNPGNSTLSSSSFKKKIWSLYVYLFWREKSWCNLIFAIGMEIDMLVSTLVIKSMALESITLPMVITTKDLGTKGVNRASACTLSVMVNPDVASGMMVISRLVFPLSPMPFFEQFRWETALIISLTLNIVKIRLLLNFSVNVSQAARRTAENAIHLRKVDEQVNKAVVASNRAATAARVAAIKAVQNRIDGKFCDTNF